VDKKDGAKVIEAAEADGTERILGQGKKLPLVQLQADLVNFLKNLSVDGHQTRLGWRTARGGWGWGQAAQLVAQRGLVVGHEAEVGGREDPRPQAEMALEEVDKHVNVDTCLVAFQEVQGAVWTKQTAQATNDLSGVLVKQAELGRVSERSYLGWICSAV
jgi:hypothetical protein